MAKVQTVDSATDTESLNHDVNPESAEELHVEMSTMEQLEAFERQREQFKKVSFAEALKEAVTAESDVERLNKEKKDTLLGVPFIITGIRVNQGDFGPFVSITGVDENERNFVINDGSTGIAAQMLSVVQTYGTDKPILVKNGLRKSEYYVDKETNRVVGKNPTENSFKATTYYLDI
jgi:hypothetical protein